ncbi:MAG: M50 family metallopeptidase [Polyangiaceae bacterium]|nr:M50 family metallopeptidase [Polyangiaceae bacterium]MCW5789955.1 M50 family metallopeptidase [Polyangiaceae bacterium]
MAVRGYDPAPRRPLSQGERLIAAGFFLLFFGALAGELLRDFRPVKLGLLAAVVSWVPLLVLHELGHALAARAVGWHVSEVVLGQGRDLVRFRWGKARVSFKLAPLIGYVRTVPTSLTGARWRQALIYAAGPLAELCLVLALWLVVGEELLRRSESLGVVLAQAVALTALLGGLFNLLPFRVPGGGASDGLGILLSAFTPRERFEWQLATPWVDLAEALLDDARGAEAEQVLEEGLAELPLHPRLRLAQARCRAELDDDAGAVAILEGFGDLESLPPGLRQDVLATGARVALIAGTEARWLDARRLAERATSEGERDEVSTLAWWVKGAALTQLGRARPALEALEVAARMADDDAELTWVFAWTAVAWARLGEPKQAELYAREVLARAPRAQVLALIEGLADEAAPAPSVD